MFKRKKLVVAVGLALSAMSMSTLACDPPVITNFTVKGGVVDGVGTGVLQGNIPACNSGTYYPQVRFMHEGSPRLLFSPNAVYPGNAFEIPVKFSAVVPIVYSGWAEIREGSNIVASTTPMPIGFSHANLPTLVNQVEFVSEEGGRVVTLSPPQNNNCPITTNINLAKSQEENFCFLEFFPTGNATKMLTQNNDITIGPAAIGSKETVSWQISKFDYFEAKKQLATGSVTVDITALSSTWKAKVTATKDTVVNKVNLTIVPPENAYELHVYRATSNGEVGTKIASLAGSSTYFQDTPPSGNSYWYYTIAETFSGKQGAQSTIVEGRANVPPTSVSASGSAVYGESVTMTPTIIDPNTGDKFSVSIPMAPIHGTATVNSKNQIIYTLTNKNFTGTDSFQFRVEDQMGNATLGVATVSASCGEPLITGQSQGQIVEWGEGVIQINYSATKCHSNLIGKFDLRDPVSGNVVHTETTQILASGTNQTLNFIIKDLPIKSYTATLTFQSDILPPTVSTLGKSILVEGVSNPVLSMEKLIWREDELASVAVTMPNVNNCLLTTNQEMAKENRIHCFVESLSIPLGLEKENVTGQFKISGYGVPRTNTPFQYQISKWDSKGNKHVVKSDIVTMTFLEASAPTFEMSASQTNVTALKDLVSTNLVQTSGAPCPVYADQTVAQADLEKGKRVCLATFTTPQGAIMQYKPNESRFVGRFNAGQSGQRSLAYKVHRIYLDKPRLTVAEGTSLFNVVDFANFPAFEVVFNKDKVVNNYDNVVAELRQLSGETCAITASETDASLSWYESGMPKCLVRWNDLPNGMAVSDVSATGKIVSPGLFSVIANASIVNPINTTEFSVNYNKNIQSVLLEAPVFEFDGKPILQGSNLYAVGDGGIIGKVTLTDDIFGSVSMSVNAGASAPVVTKGLKKGAINNVTVAPGTLWSSNNVVVKMVWDNMPELISSMTIRSVVLPPAGMQASITLPKTVVNNLPVTIGTSIGMPSNLGLRFDSSKMGSWVGYIGALQADGTVAAITDPIPITNGKANIVYPKASDISNAEIVFVAEVNSQLEGYTSKLISKPAKVVMVDGSGIVPTIHADIKSGAVPLRVKISSDIPSDQSKSLGGIEWLISNDDGATWAVIEKATSASFNHIFKERGRYKIKSKTTNRYSGEISYSGTVIVDVYALPHLEVEGRSIIRLGSTTNIIAKSTAQHIKWIIEKADGTKDTISNAHLNISSNIAQIVKATALASNEDGEALNDPAAWKEVKVDVRFISLAPVKVALSGSKVLEVGEEGELIATIKTDWDNALAGFVIHGQWRLPNGTLVDGTTLRWTPTNDDFLSSKMPVFTAWVADFAQQTATSITPRITLKKYVWPDWSLQFKAEVMQAPAAIRLTVVAPPDQLKLFSAIKEKVTYTWGLPSNVSAVVIRGGIASFVADNAGDYPVQVKIEDTRGNVKVLDYTVSVAAPAPIEVNFKTTASNSHNRVPLSLNVKPQYFRLHPKEKIVSYRFYRNETLIDDNTKGSVLINFTEPGSYLLKVEADTNLNRTVKSESLITVIANKPPLCKLNPRINKMSALVTAECKDPDGKIKSYAWKVNGEAIKSSGYRITVPLGTAFEVTVTDDSNESVALNGSV